VNDAIHHHISSISLIAAEIVKSLNTREDVAPGHINVLTTKLDAWYRDLPPMMHLENVTSNQASAVSFYQQRSILMTHVCCAPSSSMVHTYIAHRLCTLVQSYYCIDSCWLPLPTVPVILQSTIKLDSI
jgi:hypothetical protein